MISQEQLRPVEMWLREIAYERRNEGPLAQIVAEKLMSRLDPVQGGDSEDRQARVLSALGLLFSLAEQSDDGDLDSVTREIAQLCGIESPAEVTIELPATEVTYSLRDLLPKSSAGQRAIREIRRSVFE